MALTDEQMTRIGDAIRETLGEDADPDEVRAECEHHIDQWIEDSE